MQPIYTPLACPVIFSCPIVEMGMNMLHLSVRAPLP